MSRQVGQPTEENGQTENVFNSNISRAKMLNVVNVKIVNEKK
jgi:hypothetical protein